MVNAVTSGHLMHSSRDRIAGCLVGGAIGDALGGVSERGRVSLSDDTQLTLATCEAIESGDRDLPKACGEAFLRWFRAGELTGLGSATLKALRDLSAGAHWALAGARGEMAAGNGPAMRIAPLAFILDPRDAKERVTIRDVCRVTHHSDEAYIGALAVLLAIHATSWPPEGSAFLPELADGLPDSRVRDRLLAFAELPPDVGLEAVAERFGASGYVVETVPLALLAATRMTSEPFSAVLNEIVATGGDSDTIGAIAGQVAGSHLGLAGLPPALVELEPVSGILPRATACRHLRLLRPRRAHRQGRRTCRARSENRASACSGRYRSRDPRMSRRRGSGRRAGRSRIGVRRDELCVARHRSRGGSGGTSWRCGRARPRKLVSTPRATVRAATCRRRPSSSTRTRCT
jgi:ADP-ribosylglycohydrolase